MSSLISQEGKRSIYLEFAQSHVLPSPNSAYGEIRINWYFCQVQVSIISLNKQSHTSINNSDLLFLSQSPLSRPPCSTATTTHQQMFLDIHNKEPICPSTGCLLQLQVDIYHVISLLLLLLHWLHFFQTEIIIYMCLALSSKFSCSYFQMRVLRHKMFLFHGQDHWFIKENTKFWKSFQLQIAPENITFMEIITI